MIFSKIRRLLIGNPLNSAHHAHELIPKWKALALLSADALSSIAYATEEIIIPLTLLGIAGATVWSLPIAIAILALMAAALILLQKKIWEPALALLLEQHC